MDPAAATADGGAFLEFVDYAISTMSSGSDGDGYESPGEGPAPARPPWGWAVAQVLKSCCAYSSGVTATILVSDLFQSWTEQRKSLTSKRKVELTNLLKTKSKRRRLPNTITIDSIYEKKFISPKSVLEAVIIDVYVLPGTDIYMLTLGDMWSASSIDVYLHRRYYDFIGEHGILKKGREVMITGCCLRTAIEGSGHARILPTEYMVILLDEDQDEDAMLLAAQFCTYSFSSTLEESRNDVPYSFYARIEKIESLEPFRCTERKQIILADNDDAKMKFILWGEQVLLANLFSVGSMLALDRPFIANFVDSDHEDSQELCLEYGSATQVYLVPIAQQEEQVLMTPTQVRSQGPLCVPSNNVASQVTLPRDLHGSIDFSKYPFRGYVSDLHDKMVGVSLFGTVTSICKASTSGTTFYLELEDITGVVLMKLIFAGPWSLGRVGVGHMVYISGLTCTLSLTRIREVLWREKEPGSSPFVKQDAYMPCSTGSHRLQQFEFVYLTITDDSEKILAWCVGQTAVEFLQISPDEYLELPEDERAMYLYTLQNQSFMVAIANTSKRVDDEALPVWEITRAQKLE
ncbi:hypothetical protein QOZ80_3AG0209640 [Eleusine coracana subsp. coracana]|nr:hypothetical protein QOZ80_3AG0209640 [Eleusine coracana subsp. coracana]